MIIKSFEINKINIDKINFFLFYGVNEGLKNEMIHNFFKKKYVGNILSYDEKDILINEDSFFNNIFSKSFFDDKKIIIISRATDKIKYIIEEIIEKKIDDVKIILNSGVLEKKSKLRSFFEKEKTLVCIPFYEDNKQSLSQIINIFFREKKIPISQEAINLIVDRCRGDRQNLKNELNKIENYVFNKKNINIDEILKLTNLAENYNVSELADNCLAKNIKKTVNILNENNYSIEDCILITRTLLNKAKRLLNLQSSSMNNNYDEMISQYKPPIFWKDKEIVKQQIKNWNLKKTQNLIYKINNLELLIKKNSSNSINILSDFIIGVSKNSSN